jgi:DNA-binding CsgD family transcriptional regulator
MYSTIILLIVGFSFVAYRHKFIKQSEDLLKSKLQFANYEAEQLKIEKDLNSKITAISNYMIDEFKRIADRLSNSQFSRDPHILEIRADMIRLSEAELNSDPVLQSLDQQKRYSSIWELHGFQDLTKTQREILILSIEDMRPKEIAQLLNVSYSHIRNTRTLLKKQMSILKINEFSELKKLTES